MKISGVILAAGLGKRMMPVSRLTPKPLLTVVGIPIMDVIVGKLVREGASTLHVNTHHLPGQIERYAAGSGYPIDLHHEKSLLDTGGAIGNMAGNLEDSDLIMLHNGDIISNTGFAPALDFHTRSECLVTMILAGRGPSADPLRSPPPGVRVLDGGDIVGIGDPAESKQDNARSLGYTGMALLSPRSLEFFPRGKKVGLVEILNKMIDTIPGSVKGFDASADGSFCWGEIGSAEGLLDLHRRIMLERTTFDPVLPPPPVPIRIGSGSSVDPGARWKGFLDAGKKVVIEKGVILENCIVLDGVTVREGTNARETILFPGGSLKGA